MNRMNDSISRQAAIRIVDGINTWQAGWRGNAIESMKALPAAEPEPCKDAINRQEAIDFIEAGHLCNPNEPRWSDNEVVAFLKSRQAAQPERKMGKWIDNHTTCSECEWQMIDDVLETPNIVWFNFCPNCGTRMK